MFPLYFEEFAKLAKRTGFGTQSLDFTFRMFDLYLEDKTNKITLILEECENKELSDNEAIVELQTGTELRLIEVRFFVHMWRLILKEDM